MDTHFSRAGLIRRGWTATTIATLLGGPDALGHACGGRKRAHLFDSTRVLAAEAAGGWQSRAVAPRVEKPSRDELVALRAAGLTRADMADRLGTTIGTLKRWLGEAGILAPKRPKTPPSPKIAPVCLDDEEGMTLIEKARRRLALRVPPVQLGECRRSGRWPLATAWRRQLRGGSTLPPRVSTCKGTCKGTPKRLPVRRIIYIRRGLPTRSK